MKQPVLSAKELTTYLQKEGKACPVVDRLSFDLYKGKTLAIVGESGCGKSMTAFSIMRVLSSPPVLFSTGEVLFKGRNLLALSEKEMQKVRGAEISMIFQNPSTSLNPVYTIGYQLVEVAELHLNLYGKDAEDRAKKALEEVGIPSPLQRLNEYPHQLSGGMKQRVMIAMALMCEPDILIADEPTTALDVTIQAQVLDLMRGLQEKKGMAILLITHDMGVVAEMAHEVLVMYASEGVEKGSSLDIFDAKAHPYTIGLFNSIPPLGKSEQRLKAIKGVVPPLAHYPSGCRFHPRCPLVMEKCKEAKVEEFSINQSSHVARCLLYDGSTESVKQLAKKIDYE